MFPSGQLEKFIEENANGSTPSFLSPFSPSLIRMASKLTFYFSPSCEGCAELEPVAREAARRKGWSFRKVNVEECRTDVCEGLDLVPTLYLDGREMSIGEMERVLNG